MNKRHKQIFKTTTWNETLSDEQLTELRANIFPFIYHMITLGDVLLDDLIGINRRRSDKVVEVRYAIIYGLHEAWGLRPAEIAHQLQYLDISVRHAIRQSATHHWANLTGVKEAKLFGQTILGVDK
jgi:hypothetical protein